MWLPDIDGRRGPVYRVIADAIDEAVQDGTLRAGMRLPPHRDLADHLGVTVTTITRAYTEASRRGLTSGHVGRGTFIGTMMGAGLSVQVLNATVFLSLDQKWQYIFQGLLIVAGALIYSQVRRRGIRSTSRL